VANFARASATIVRQPSCFAAAHSASAVSTAPDHEQPRRRPVDLREDLAAVVELEQRVAAGAQ
jgi:hypothetical protein